MDACTLAAKYADQLIKARDLTELGAVSSEIKTRLGDLVGLEQWLRDIYISAYKSLTEPEYKPEETLNQEGLAALKRGEISL